MIVHELTQALSPLCADITIRSAVCGSGFTAVQLSDGQVGISFRYPTLEPVRYAGSLAGRPARDILQLLVEGNLQETSLGCAVANALTAEGRGQLPGGSLYEHIALRPTDTVGVIGNFRRFLDPIRQQCKALYVFELAEGDGLCPAWMEPRLLPECDTVIITGAALLNHTLDGILSCCTAAREIVLMGPSVVQLPQVFAAHGITLLAGAEVLDGARTLRCIQEGCNGQMIRQLTRDTCVRIR